MLNLGTQNSLRHMKKINSNTNLSIRQSDKKEQNTLPGYPLYPAGEDIYSKSKKVMKIDPEEGVSVINESKEKEFNDDLPGSDLDVPGSELDDKQESIGSEDEENNYYSLGGDDHNDLDENIS